jgi:hypothetical protein
MAKVQDLLSSRCKTGPKKSSKMAALAEQTARGERSGFAGLFSVTDLSDGEKDALESILDRYSTGEQDLTEDLASLVSITSEVQAINNQAALLHGERIKRAQTILKRYSDGAFTAWLIETYGNRQTPYNLLQYYEFYTAVSAPLRKIIETMPRQAIYTLASREAKLEDKCQLVENYSGQTKAELLALIRETFPLNDDDGRRTDSGEATLSALRKAAQLLGKRTSSMTRNQRDELLKLLEELRTKIQKSKTKR